jgi:hypothetical protein
LFQSQSDNLRHHQKQTSRITGAFHHTWKVWRCFTTYYLRS